MPGEPNPYASPNELADEAPAVDPLAEQLRGPVREVGRTALWLRLLWFACVCITADIAMVGVLEFVQRRGIIVGVGSMQLGPDAAGVLSLLCSLIPAGIAVTIWQGLTAIAALKRRPTQAALGDVLSRISRLLAVFVVLVAFVLALQLLSVALAIAKYSSD